MAEKNHKSDDYSPAEKDYRDGYADARARRDSSGKDSAAYRSGYFAGGPNGGRSSRAENDGGFVPNE